MNYITVNEEWINKVKVIAKNNERDELLKSAWERHSVKSPLQRAKTFGVFYNIIALGDTELQKTMSLDGLNEMELLRIAFHLIDEYEYDESIINYTGDPAVIETLNNIYIENMDILLENIYKSFED